MTRLYLAIDDITHISFFKRAGVEFLVQASQIQKILTEYQEWMAGANESGVRQFVSFDRQRDQYLLFYVGWRGKERDKENCLE